MSTSVVSIHNIRKSISKELASLKILELLKKCSHLNNLYRTVVFVDDCSAEFFKKTALKFFIFRHIYQNVSFFSYDFTPNIQAILPVLTSPKICCTFEPENKGKKELFEILVRRFLVKYPCPRGQGHFSEQ